MKKLIILLFMLASTATFAQNTGKEDAEIIQGLFGKSKKELVESYMKFTPEQASSFWKVYDAYEVERKEIGKRKIEIISVYAENYMNLNDEKADELAKASLQNSMAYEKLNTKYYPKFSKAAGGMNAAKFMQFEVYIHTIIRAELQDAIPFIDEIERSKPIQ